jgi:cobalt-zinc-cadmium efflux system membrane fusion protein
MNEDRVVHVVPRISGVVRSVHKNFGESVVEGEILTIIDSRELADAKSEYLAARERRELAQSRFKREEDLYKRKVSSEDDYLTAKEAHAESRIRERTARQKLAALGLDEEAIKKTVDEPDSSLTEYAIRAPLSGSVIEKHVSGGEGVSADSDIFLLADLSTVWVEVTVYPQDLKKIRPGLPVLVRSEDLDSEAEGVVAYLGPLVRDDTRSALAIVELPNPEGIWRPGLYVTADIVTNETEVAMAVPLVAIQQFRDFQVVFAQFGDTYEIRMLELGRSDGEWVEVLSGIEPGQPFVSQNSYVLKADLEKSGAVHDH